MLHTIERAYEYYRHYPDIWKKLQLRGMNSDFSWDHSAKEYIKLYQSLFEHKKQEKNDEPEENPVVVDI